jgi:hypothetical protein
MVLTVGDIVLFGGFKILARPVEAHDVFTALVCANMVGVFTSVILARWRREQFRVLKQESEARAELDRTLREIKTLKRIIPICSVCRKLRTDEGAWETFESYILEHTDSDFSHGVCPDCVGAFLGDEDERTTE